jgi:DNA-binding NarL/FixJ family response regulator
MIVLLILCALALMPEMNGVDADRLISSYAPECILILFTMFASDQLIALARPAGVREVISKSQSIPTLLVFNLPRPTDAQPSQLLRRRAERR